MWEKIEIYFFDIMGLLIPGIVFVTGIIFTSLFLISGQALSDILDVLNKIAFFKIYLKMEEVLKKHIWLFVVFVIFNSYLIGHVIKIMSKVFYWFFSIIFDQFFNKIFSFIISWLWKNIRALISFLKIGDLFKDINPDFKKFVMDFIKSFYKFFHHNLKVIFVFGTEWYEKDNKPLLEESLRIINERYDTNFPTKWYSIYKLSKIIIYHENLKNMNDTFLAKYNFYRSLSFICFLQFTLLIILSFNKELLNDYSDIIINILMIVNLIFWYTFHEKYKRYFKLCGNETLVSIYYHLKTTERKG
ncbi:hypothetical protein [Neobacillus thermocopriae]|uniref:Uncharacterized protein n=1 Tax=Neobacillus thermocopriae TaxID=1215031 RepID=A0A6B3TLZ4_9BACI|nr:hypothetical protein [Neobacillus thermocopriae]NEX77964.1 hypothetical protein [Neobacillus thermocopriae]